MHTLLHTAIVLCRRRLILGVPETMGTQYCWILLELYGAVVEPYRPAPQNISKYNIRTLCFSPHRLCYAILLLWLYYYYEYMSRLVLRNQISPFALLLYHQPNDEHPCACYIWLYFISQRIPKFCDRYNYGTVHNFCSQSLT